MTFPTRRSNKTFSPLSAAETVAEHRTRLAQEQEIALQLRTDALAGQVAMTNSPSERVRIWERLHDLPLPRSPNHRLLEVIALETQLHIEQVQEIQKLRGSPRNRADDTGGDGKCAPAP